MPKRTLAANSAEVKDKKVKPNDKDEVLCASDKFEVVIDIAAPAITGAEFKHKTGKERDTRKHLYSDGKKGVALFYDEVELALFAQGFAKVYLTSVDMPEDADDEDKTAYAAVSLYREGVLIQMDCHFNGIVTFKLLTAINVLGAECPNLLLTIGEISDRDEVVKINDSSFGSLTIRAASNVQMKCVELKEAGLLIEQASHVKDPPALGFVKLRNITSEGPVSITCATRTKTDVTIHNGDFTCGLDVASYRGDVEIYRTSSEAADTSIICGGAKVEVNDSNCEKLEVQTNHYDTKVWMTKCLVDTLKLTGAGSRLALDKSCEVHNLKIEAPECTIFTDNEHAITELKNDETCHFLEFSTNMQALKALEDKEAEKAAEEYAKTYVDTDDELDEEDDDTEDEKTAAETLEMLQTQILAAKTAPKEAPGKNWQSRMIRVGGEWHPKYAGENVREAMRKGIAEGDTPGLKKKISKKEEEDEDEVVEVPAPKGPKWPFPRKTLKKAVSETQEDEEEED